MFFGSHIKIKYENYGQKILSEFELLMLKLVE